MVHFPKKTKKNLKILQLAAVNVRIEDKSSNPCIAKSNFKKKKGQEEAFMHERVR